MTKEELETYLERREAVLRAVREIVVEQLEVDRPAEEVDPDAPLFVTGLGLDSLDAVELVSALEARFRLTLSDGAETIASRRTLGTIVDVVMREAK